MGYVLVTDRVLHWKNAWLITLNYCIGGMDLSLSLSQYVRLLCWRDLAVNPLDCCTGGMHFSMQWIIILDGLVAQYNS